MEQLLASQQAFAGIGQTVQTQAAFLAYMANEQGSMVSPTAVKALGKDFALKPVGTGPFILIARGSNEIDAVRWDHYWQMGADGKPLPYLDRVHMSSQ